jgi:glycosyltransferase involved in cell wall biosynthesis
MRIAYVCADLGVPVFGRKGCSIHVQEVVRAFCRLGARVELFTPCPEGAPPVGLETVPIHPLPAITHPDAAAGEQAALAANSGLRAALEHAGPFDLVYERYSLWSFAGMAYAEDAGAPGLLEVNAPLIEEQAEHRTLVDRQGAEEVARRVFRAATALVAVSAEVASYLEGYTRARRRVHVVPNGVDPQRFPPRLRLPQPGEPGTFVVGFVGSLKPWHGLPTLVEAFALLHRRHPDTRLLVVGDGPQRADLLDDLARRGLCGDATLTGAVGPEEVPRLLAGVDAAVAPYPKLRGFYFSPLKVYEYMAAGAAVVASRVGQLAELIRHRVNGLACPPGDPAALAAALEELKEDPGLRRRLGEQGRATVLRGHTWEAVAQRILQLAKVAPAQRERPSEALGGAPGRGAL